MRHGARRERAGHKQLAGNHRSSSNNQEAKGAAGSGDSVAHVTMAMMDRARDARAKPVEKTGISASSSPRWRDAIGPAVAGAARSVHTPGAAVGTEQWWSQLSQQITGEIKPLQQLAVGSQAYATFAGGRERSLSLGRSHAQPCN